VCVRIIGGTCCLRRQHRHQWPHEHRHVISRDGELPAPFQKSIASAPVGSPARWHRRAGARPVDTHKLEQLPPSTRFGASAPSRSTSPLRVHRACGGCIANPMLILASSCLAMWVTLASTSTRRMLFRRRRDGRRLIAARSTAGPSAAAPPAQPPAKSNRRAIPADAFTRPKVLIAPTAPRPRPSAFQQANARAPPWSSASSRGQPLHPLERPPHDRHDLAAQRTFAQSSTSATNMESPSSPSMTWANAAELIAENAAIQRHQGAHRQHRDMVRCITWSRAHSTAARILCCARIPVEVMQPGEAVAERAPCRPRRNSRMQRAASVSTSSYGTAKILWLCFPRPLP